MGNAGRLAIWPVVVLCGLVVWAQDQPYQHVPLPKELPKGVSIKDAQQLQSVIDEYTLMDPLKVTKIRDNIYLAKGGSDRNDPNLGFVVGKTGVIVVDSKNTADSERAVLPEIEKITSKPVKTVIILHSEHQGGIGALPKGLTIIAHDNAKKEMEVSTARDRVPSDYFPTKTVGNDETLTIDGVRVRLLHWAPAYTNGDLTAYFPDQKVVFASDLVVNDFPLGATVIDKNEHGSVAGWMENIKGMLALNADVYVSGHGPLFTKNDVRTKLAFVQDKWDKIKAMVAEGKSLDEIKTAIGGPPERNPSTTENIYTELSAQQSKN